MYDDPSQIVPTTTTTTFSMNCEIAKGQQFMDARLIETATDPLNPTIKERGIY
ncbi:uncharacterized protein MELLADRAFT_88273 [Melampsora larici-populina 98AG31]|uniref:RGS1/SST2-like Fungal-Differentiation Regulator domain-containing protein n=1 Tax=Melampsora larici-populina (strain 98AG31 / pathotype 3-4-7) TaxID=747676 RepID=F4RR76_MELLP|nr:uncharacterized protein MELLADRAFT_88273 [Melampsora larici-populina 98AG31]EGG05167.1 hypothetical protein MELLADRAFT_88273 [Melampsora larici-populina 98AG31]